MKNNHKLSICLLSVAILLSQVVPAMASSGDMSDEQINIDMRIELITEKFKKNGHNLLCNQDGYLKCFKISEKKCAQDIQKINDSCLEYSRKKVDEISDLQQRPKKMGKIYATCLTMKHSTQYEGSVDGLKTCLQSVSIDKEKMKKTAME